MFYAKEAALSRMASAVWSLKALLSDFQSKCLEDGTSAVLAAPLDFPMRAEDILRSIDGARRNLRALGFERASSDLDEAWLLVYAIQIHWMNDRNDSKCPDTLTVAVQKIHRAAESVLMQDWEQAEGSA